MSFDSAQHPRATDGKFAEKQGTTPEVALDAAPRASGHWPPLSGEVGLNGYSQVQAAQMLSGEDPAERRARSTAALRHHTAVGAGRPLNTFRPPGTAEFEEVIEKQGIVGVVKSVVRQGDGLYRHEMLLARDGFFGTNVGRFVGVSSSSEPMTAGAAIRTAIGRSPVLGQDAEFNDVAFQGLYSSEEEGELREVYDQYVATAIQVHDAVAESAASIRPGEVVRPTAGGSPAIVNRVSTAGNVTRLDYMDGRVDVVERGTELDRW